jgi:hypothetical protein
MRLATCEFFYRENKYEYRNLIIIKNENLRIGNLIENSTFKNYLVYLYNSTKQSV